MINKETLQHYGRSFELLNEWKEANVQGGGVEGDRVSCRVLPASGRVVTVRETNSISGLSAEPRLVSCHDGNQPRASQGARNRLVIHGK